MGCLDIYYSKNKSENIKISLIGMVCLLDSRFYMKTMDAT